MAKKCCGCIGLRSGTIACGIVSLIFSMSAIVAVITTLFYGNTNDSYSTMRIVLLINSIIDLVASVSCIQGACMESRNYLLPWIFVASVAIVSSYVVGLSYMIYGFLELMVLGGIILVIAFLFSLGWICVLSYYYELCERSFSQQRTNRRNGRSNNQSTTSIATFEDYRTPPPPYSMVYKNPVFEEDKPPSYEEVRETTNPALESASSQTAEENRERY